MISREYIVYLKYYKEVYMSNDIFRRMWTQVNKVEVDDAVPIPSIPEKWGFITESNVALLLPWHEIH